jgi:inosine-uridine nucleoside N-ribohydrolase
MTANRPTVRPSDRLVVDTDPGIDDVVTLALAARSPELDIVAVTTSFGNTTLEAATRNCREILRLCGRSDIPVYPGAREPLKRTLVTAAETHGVTGVGYAPVPPDPTSISSPGGKTVGPVIANVLAGLNRPVTLVTLGPLTNLASALLHDPALVRSRVRRHIGMFGTVKAAGNTNRWADFNAWADPEAADIVLRADLGTEMVGLDVTRKMVLTAEEMERFAGSRDPLIGWLGQALRFYVEFHRIQERLDGCVVNDVLTIGELLDPGLLSFSNLPLAVDLDEGEHRGHTRISPGGSTLRVALEVDVGRMRELLQRVFGATLSREPPAISYSDPRLPASPQ